MIDYEFLLHGPIPSGISCGGDNSKKDAEFERDLSELEEWAENFHEDVEISESKPSKADSIPSEEIVKEECVEGIPIPSSSDDQSSTSISFPSIEELEPALSKLRSTSDKKLLSTIKRYNERHPSPSFLSHVRSRNTFLAINIVLNERAIIASAFRPFRKVNKHSGLSDGEKLLSVDTQIIDLHYLFENYKDQISPTDEKYKPLFNSEVFDFDLADKFAREVWSVDHKILSLNIPENVEMELRVYSQVHVRDHRRNTEKTIPNVKKKLIELKATPHSRLTEENVYNRLDQYRCLKLAKGSPSEAVRLMGVVYGYKYGEDEISAQKKAFTGHKKWFNDRLGISTWKKKD